MPAASRTPEQDTALVYGFVEELTGNDSGADVAARFLAEDFVARDGAAAPRHARFPDAVWTSELPVSVAGRVICHTTVAYPESRDGVPAPQRTVVARVAAGGIAECWCARDECMRADDTPPRQA